MAKKRGKTHAERARSAITMCGRPLGEATVIIGIPTCEACLKALEAEARRTVTKLIAPRIDDAA